MRKVKISIDTGFCGAVHEEIIELPEDMTDEDIDEYATNSVWEYIQVYWSEIK